jgi:curved DNA-binding protein CbpA
MSKNYYELLNVSKNATPCQIKKAYRTKALKLHPDKNSCPQATLHFLEVQEAYDILGNTEKKYLYDKIIMEEVENKNSNQCEYANIGNFIVGSTLLGVSLAIGGLTFGAGYVVVGFIHPFVGTVPTIILSIPIYAKYFHDVVSLAGLVGKLGIEFLEDSYQGYTTKRVKRRAEEKKPHSVMVDDELFLII